MKHFKIIDLLIGIVFTLLFISVAVVVTINFRPLYYMDIHQLHIEADSGIDKAEIKQNYDALIDYSSPFFKGDLKFPTLESSQSGLLHFAEVKTLFTDFYVLGAVTLLFGIIIIIRKAKNKDYGYFLVSAITALVLPLLLGLYMSMNFEKAFIAFHKLFFNNNDWMFDPATDPVIMILPEDFFMHCAFLIVAIVVLFSAVFIGIYCWNKSHTGIRYRKNKGLKI